MLHLICLLHQVLCYFIFSSSSCLYLLSWSNLKCVQLDWNESLTFFPVPRFPFFPLVNWLAPEPHVLRTNGEFVCLRYERLIWMITMTSSHLTVNGLSARALSAVFGGQEMNKAKLVAGQKSSQSQVGLVSRPFRVFAHNEGRTD